MSDRARNNFVLVFVIALVLVSLMVTAGIPGVVKAKKLPASTTRLASAGSTSMAMS